jgi:hypothetical protein
MPDVIHVPVDSFVPLKFKTWAALAGSIFTVVAPWILSASSSLPEPWPGLVGGVFGILTVLGVYHAPYVPKSAQQPKTATYTPPTGTGSSPWPE